MLGGREITLVCDILHIIHIYTPHFNEIIIQPFQVSTTVYSSSGFLLYIDKNRLDDSFGLLFFKREDRLIYFLIIFSPANDCIKIIYFIWFLFLYLCQTKSLTYEKHFPAFFKHFSFPHCFRAGVNRSYGTSFLVDRYEK